MNVLARSPTLALLMLALVLAEWLWRRRRPQFGYDGKGAWASVAVGLGHVFSTALSAGVLGGLFLGAWRLAPVHWSMQDWRVWVIGFFAVELAYYWMHRCSHTVRWIWANHAVHHTPEQMTLLSAIRLGWTNLLSMAWVFYLPLVLAGFDPRMVFVLLAFNLQYQFFLHTEVVRTLGPLEWIFNTPAHHRVHHASNPYYLDCNYGGVLIVYDRLFGTLRKERADQPLRYGLAHPLGTQNPFGLAFGEWGRLLADLRRASGPREVWRMIAGRP
ncbi:sterol desaturase family protein [Oleiagrimonas soli]|uniref:Sterol desaturase n=1 Tax=Oleiagrimonas soli TaxID=1543381 RepID=A0A099CT30_9GAMM|nr:sterol desaturase family protein [Oleiagrimonas soli]KGI76929.1 sterol desaturase [Oleiagrimonas soli]MBB6185204.1 sterol desaturase/sphingolipid hydroxylase (fatty acid hydroxylase superfamily) [Oleiagrimonas soli]